jgi:hypothetical protein
MKNIFSVLEKEADDHALRIIELSWPVLSKQMNLSSNMSRLYHVDQIGYAASYLGQWSAFWNTDPELSVHESFKVSGVSLPATKNILHNKAKEFLCDFEKKKKGKWIVPIQYGNTHPSPTQRMVSISTKLKQKIDANTDAKANYPMSDMQSLISGILVDVDSYVADYSNQLTDEICGVALSNKLCSE